MTEQEWSLSDAQRVETVKRIATSITNLSFSQGHSVAETVAADAAATVEKKAYTVAKFESKTTTGYRPHNETLKAYARKLSELVLNVVKEKGQTQQGGISSDGKVLDLSGDREPLTKDTAEEALAPLFASNPAITTVRLSTKSFDAECAEVAARGFSNVAASLTDVDMSDVIAGRPEAQALEALRIMTCSLQAAQLRALNLSDNALGEKGIRACAAALSGQTGLQRLAFQNVGCSIRACQAVAELVQHSQELRRLHLFNNMSGDEGAVAIAQILSRSPQMEDFKMASSRVGSEGCIALAQSLQHSSCLTRLDLSDNPTDSEIGPALAEMLRGQKQLVALNLADTSLEDQGIEAIAEALAAAAPPLQELNLALNSISPAGIPALTHALQGMTALRSLDLGENELEDDGAVQLAPALQHLKQLQHLSLITNQIGTRGAMAVTQAIAASCSDLKELLLNGNQISEEGVQRIQNTLKAAGKIDALGPLDENEPDDAEDEGDEETDDLTEQLEKSARIL
ncbi:hypothetical protein WJX74_003728 [Apatococcus lobatus]|uniref:WPP domain-containing protein n=1 Tax=Apatococcus lobatus TaxID=904363 RepID=A0AAW1R2L9_9CHLO